jgi:hypothetical protein
MEILFVLVECQLLMSSCPAPDNPFLGKTRYLLLTAT